MTSKQTDYSWVRGFGHMCGWGDNGREIWTRFDENRFEAEISAAKKHFPKVNTLREFLSFDAWVSDKDMACDAFCKAYSILCKYDIQMMPVLFSGWNSVPSYGGFSVEQIRFTFYSNQWEMQRQYIKDLFGALPDTNNILMVDLANEPFNSTRNSLEETKYVNNFLGEMASEVKKVYPEAICTAGSQGILEGYLPLIREWADAFAIHPYWCHNFPGWTKDRHLKELDEILAYLKATGLPFVANECCWGHTDDFKRSETGRFELEHLVERGVGFMPHSLNWSPVADCHREDGGPVWGAGYMSFIERDLSLRPHHGFYNEFC